MQVKQRKREAKLSNFLAEVQKKKKKDSVYNKEHNLSTKLSNIYNKEKQSSWYYIGKGVPRRGKPGKRGKN